jgi:REG-2-like HAD superfamily hydrolase
MSNPTNSDEFVFLDAGGTLIYIPRLEVIFSEACSMLGMRIEILDIRAAMQRALKRVPASGPSSLDRETHRRWWTQFLLASFEEIGVAGDRERMALDLWDEYRSGRWLRLFPDTVDALKQLRESGRRVGVISNWDDTLEDFLAKLGIRDFFDVIVSSYLAGVEKPDAKIFYHALNLAGVNAEAAWHIGDDVTFDYLGASACGIRAILVDYYGSLSGSEGIACPIVKTLTEAVKVITSSENRTL